MTAQADIIVNKLNEAFVELVCDESVKAELNDYFSFFAPNYQFSPLYKKKIWNGKIYLYSKKKSHLYGGLLRFLKNFCKERELKIAIDSNAENFDTFTEQDAQEFIKSLDLHSQNKPIEPRDYQIRGFVDSVKYKKLLLLSPTASGKSLIIYMLMRYLLKNKCGKGLLIVPTISLVEQMYGDFKDYSTANGWDVEKHCHKIYQGQDKEINKSLTISTWQSIHELGKKFFEQFDFVIGDEAHSFKAKSLSAIMTKMIYAKYRIGTTGTIDDTEVHKLVLEGHFGPTTKVITTKELIDNKQLSDFEIKCLILKYPERYCKMVKEMDFQKEIEFIVTNPYRNKFISNLALDQKGNTLILFQFVEKHGKVLFELLKEKMVDDRKLFFVHGGIEAEDREQIRAITETQNNAIIVASYGTFSTGINIRNLHNIVFASPTKSRIRNLQSVGRGLRKGDAKTHCNLYDIGDDLTWKARKNYTLLHMIERIKTYNDEHFDYNLVKVPLNVL
jgi:superfamily II DNA or RNA helicase